MGCGGDDSTTTPPAETDSGTDSQSMMDATNKPDSGPDAPSMPDVVVMDSPVTPDAPSDVMPMTQLKPPTFMPTPPATFVVGTTVSITCPDLPMTGNGFIFYTLDGTLPSHSSPAYSGPIQINNSLTIHAMCSDVADGFADSMVATGAYTTTAPPTEGGAQPGPVQFNPPAGKVSNDFNLALSDADGAAIICYTKDAQTTPACNAAGNGCSAGTLYNGGTPIRIDGTVTDTSGNVTVQAIACAPNAPASTVVSQNYTLQVAPPTMVNPDTSKVLVFATDTPAQPTMSSTTNPTGTSNVSFWVGLGATMPTCVTGTQVANPYQVGSTAALAAIVHNTTYNIVACKANYAPSPVTSFSYQVQLNAPKNTLPAGTYDGTIANNVDDSANNAASHWLCWSNDPAKVATCNATTADMCAVGNVITTANSGSATEPVNVTKTGQSFTTQACSVSTNNTGYVNSPAPTPAAYTLVLDQAGFSPPGAGKNAYTFTATDTGTVTLLQNTPANNPGGVSVTTIDHICVGDATVTALDCTCNNVGGHGTSKHVGDTIAVAIPAAGHTTVMTALACSADATTIGNAASFTVTYSPIGAPTSPSISPADGATFNGTVGSGGTPVDTALVFTNQDQYPSQICFTTDGTNPPACATDAHTTCSPTGAGNLIQPMAPNNTYSPTVTIQNENTTVYARACNTQETAAPTPSKATFHFKIAKPTFSLVPEGTTPGDLNGGGAVGAGQQIQVDTASDFSGMTINYTITAGATATPVTCAAGGANHSLAPGGQIPVPSNMTNTFTIQAIGCGSAGPVTQQSSDTLTATFTVTNAPPTITQDATNKTGDLTWENTFGFKFASVTAGSSICYTNAPGDHPICNAAGACTHGISAANPSPASIPVTQSGTTIHAIACSASLPASNEVSATYTLQMSQVVANGDNACPETFTIQMNTGAPDNTAGGPTNGATICYSLDGTTAPDSSCGPKANTHCIVSPATGTYAPISVTAPLLVKVCNPAGTQFLQPTSIPTNLTVAAYKNPNPIVTDGTFSGSEWVSAQNLVTDSVGSGTHPNAALYSHSATTLYFGVNEGEYTPAATTSVVIYLGDNTSNGSTSAPLNLQGNTPPTLPFHASYAIIWPTDNSSPASLVHFTGGAWGAPTTPASLKTGFNSGAHVEFEIGLADIGSPATVDAVGAIVQNIGNQPTTTLTWPAKAAGATPAYQEYFSDDLSACTFPNGTIVP